MEIRISGAQIPVIGDIDANISAIECAINYASENGADILLTPEGSLSGYTHKFDIEVAEEALEYITQKARESNLGLALGTCFVEPEDQKCYNQIRFYKPDGDYLGFHSKTLTCGSMTEPPKGEINHYSVSPLRTFDFNDIQIGGLICNDLWANPGCTPIPDPHLTQQLSKMGAKIVFHAVNGGRSDSEWSDVAWQYHSSNLRMRANAGGIWIVTVDNCYPTDIRCSSPTGIINPQGDWVCQTEIKGEQFFCHTIKL